VNFSLYSRSASGVDLLLFDREDDPRPSRVVSLDPARNRDYHYWHTFVPGLQDGQIYTYRIHGSFEPSAGLRFDSTRILLDPYGRRVLVPRGYNRRALSEPGADVANSMKSAVVDLKSFDWEGDKPLRRSSARTIIYEMHVRGMTCHHSSGISDHLRGTYAGFIEKIPYLKDLGVTAVELLPVFQFDPQDCPIGLVNYWGYAPLSFFAPHHAYSSDQSRLGPVNEFRAMVKALHGAGIEIILDVVFNHTAEGSERGPTLCFRGIDNPTYYILESDKSRYANFSGTGNTLNANHPVVRRMIVDSLCYWVEEMHVDGFRFDLASILARDSSGSLLSSPPVLWDIESDPRLAGTKFIAEAWDAAGLYQVGTFIGDSWKEWNGRFRDDVRDFFRGAQGSVRRIADRMLGSPEIYGHEEREAEQSVNFVTCHDGFTLNDLVSYNHKHNDANREGNRDGSDDNRSWNCGAEGPTGNREVELLRNRQVKNFLAVTIFSLGVPMILMGDEIRQTQSGNNNAYCQDNEISWMDWALLEGHPDVHRFLKLMIQRRMQRSIGPELRRQSLNELLKTANKAWHGTKLNQPDWSDDSHSLALSAEIKDEHIFVHWILNAYWEPLTFELPRLAEGSCWHRWIDTTLESPHDITEWNSAPLMDAQSYVAGPRSVVVLVSSTGQPQTAPASEVDPYPLPSLHHVPMRITRPPLNWTAFRYWIPCIGPIHECS
jgi:glycogen operon protein